MGTSSFEKVSVALARYARRAAKARLARATQTLANASALAAYRSSVGSINELTRAETLLLQAKNAATDPYRVRLSAAASRALPTGALGAPPK